VTRALQVLLAFAFVVAGLTVIDGNRPAVAAPAAQSPAIERLQTCLRTSDRLLAAVVIDESASLRRTDPTDQRVPAAALVLDGLARLVEQRTTDQPLQVDVTVAGFSADFHPGSWTRLGPQTADQVRGEIDTFAARDTGQDTDFYTAVDGAQQALARQAALVTAAGEALPCRLVVLFTDGRFDIDTKGDKPYASGGAPKDVKNRAGMEALCAPGGPMVHLRGDGTVTVALALSNPSVPNGADPTFLERMTSGACPTPDPAAGLTLDVSDASGLLGIFDDVATVVRGGTATGATCDGGPATFTVPASSSGFHVFADAGSPPSGAQLTGPGGDAVPITPGTDGAATLGAARVTWHWVGAAHRFVVVEGTLPPSDPSWAGAWTLDFRAPQPGASCRVSLFDSWRSTLTAPRSLARGSTAALEFRVVDAAGHPADVASLPGAISADATIRDTASSAPSAPLTLTATGPGTFRADVPVPDSFAGQQAEIVSTFRFTVDGTELRSTPSVALVPVRTPAGYPTVSPAALRLSSVDGTGVARGTLTVRADAVRDGRAWVDGVRLASSLPVARDELVPDLGRATTAASALAIPKGTTARYPVAVRVREGADGTVRGTLVVHVASSVRPEPAQTTVAFTFLMTRPVDEARRIEVMVLLLALALLVPLVLLWSLAYLGARFEPPSELRAASVPFTVGADGLLLRRTDAGAEPFLLTIDDFSNVIVEPGRLRRFECRGVRFRARMSRNPLRAPYGEAIAAGDAVGPNGRSSASRPFAARVPLALPGAWVATVADVARSEARAGGEVLSVSGSLLVFVAAAVPFNRQSEWINDAIERSVADAVLRLAASLPVPVPEPEPEPGRPGDGPRVPVDKTATGARIAPPDY